MERTGESLKHYRVFMSNGQCIWVEQYVIQDAQLVRGTHISGEPVVLNLDFVACILAWTPEGAEREAAFEESVWNYAQDRKLFSINDAIEAERERMIREATDGDKPWA